MTKSFVKNQRPQGIYVPPHKRQEVFFSQECHIPSDSSVNPTPISSDQKSTSESNIRNKRLPCNTVYIPPHLRRQKEKEESHIISFDVRRRKYKKSAAVINDWINKPHQENEQLSSNDRLITTAMQTHQLSDKSPSEDITSTLQTLELSDSEDICPYLTPCSSISDLSVFSTASGTHHRKAPEIDYSAYGHILELYDFSSDVRMRVLQEELAFIKTGFSLKWVDDNHCLAVFSSEEQAELALEQYVERFSKVRRLKDCCEKSIWKIKKSPGDWSMPFKERPQTTALTAQRLIFRALGQRIPKGALEKERQLMNELRQKRLLRRQQTQADD